MSLSSLSELLVKHLCQKDIMIKYITVGIHLAVFILYRGVALVVFF